MEYDPGTLKGMNCQPVGTATFFSNFKIESKYMMENNKAKYFSSNNKVVDIPLIGSLYSHVHRIEHLGRTILHLKTVSPSKYLKWLPSHPHGILQQYCFLDSIKKYIKLKVDLRGKRKIGSKKQTRHTCLIDKLISTICKQYKKETRTESREKNIQFLWFMRA